nr:unnamed protein product [Callosobruchus analis]
MELHPDFAKNRISAATGRATMKKLWEELTNQLNSLGLGQRSTAKESLSGRERVIQRIPTWTEYKCVLKRKAADNKSNIDGKGGGPPRGSVLTALDQRVLSILGTSFYQGLGMPENGGEVMSDVVKSTINCKITLKPAFHTLCFLFLRLYSKYLHYYIRQPSRKQNRTVTSDSNIANMYVDTLRKLKEIKSCLSDLTTTARRIEAAIVNLSDIIKNK